MTIRLSVHSDPSRRLLMAIRKGYLLLPVFALALLASAPNAAHAQQSIAAADPDAPLPLSDDGQYPANRTIRDRC